jgi:hypothetical protein
MKSSWNILEWSATKEKTIGVLPWLAGIVVVLMVLCFSVRQVAIHNYRVAAEYFGAQIVTYYEFPHDIVCFTGGSLHPYFTYCRRDWPYEAYLGILTLLLVALLAMWAALRRKWYRSSLPTEMTRPDQLNSSVSRAYVPPQPLAKPIELRGGSHTLIRLAPGIENLVEIHVKVPSNVFDELVEKTRNDRTVEVDEVNGRWVRRENRATNIFVDRKKERLIQRKRNSKQ